MSRARQGRNLAAKLAVLVISIGAVQVVILGARQARIQIAHEMSQARLRSFEQEADLLDVRAEIVQLSAPERVAIMSSHIGSRLASIEESEDHGE